MELFNSKLLNFPDFVKIGVTAFLFIFLMNRLLRAASASSFTTSGK